MEQKKLEERSILARFLWLSKLTRGLKADKNGDSPDFLFTSETGKIGIEVTKIVRLPGVDRIAPPAKESLHWRIIENAHKIFAGKSTERLNVSASFDDLGRISREDQTALSEKIAQFVLANTFDEKWKFFPDDDYSAVPPEGVNMLLIVRSPELADDFWTASGGGFVPTLEREHLQKEIDRKNILLPKYRPADKQVLLVVESSGGLSTHFTKLEDAVDHEYQSDFDDVYLLSYSEKRYWRLKTK